MSRLEHAVVARAARLSVRQIALVGGVTVAIALALALLPPLTAAWLVLGTGVTLLILRQPRVGLYLLPPVVAFGDAIALTVGGLRANPTDLLFAALALAWLLAGARAWWADRRAGAASVGSQVGGLFAALRRDRWRAALCAALVAYLAVVVASLAVASSISDTLKEILKWGEVAALVPLAYWLLDSPKRLRALAWSVVATGAAEAALGIFQWVLAGGNAQAQSRIVGTFDQPNPFAGFLNFALPLALALVFFGRDAIERWMAGAAAELLVAAAVLARSRGATLGLIAALIVLAAVAWRRERLAAVALAVSVPALIAAWVADLIPESVRATLLDQVRLDRLDNVSLCSDINSTNFSLIERQAHWVAGLRMFAAHPVMGVGAGNYAAQYSYYAPPCWVNPLGHAHNYYINAAAETGVIGLAAFLALTVVALLVGWVAARRACARRPALAPEAETPDGAQSPRRALALGFFGAIIALSVHNLTDDLFVHGMALLFALSLGVLLLLLRPRVLRRGAG